MSIMTFVHRLNKRAMELYFLHALGTMHAKCKAALAKKAEGKGNLAMAAKHQYMDSSSRFYTFFLIQNRSFAPVHRISFRRSGRNRHKSARATFFSLEEGSNFVQKSRQHRTPFDDGKKSCAVENF